MTTATLDVKPHIAQSSNTYTHKMREFSTEDKTTTLELLAKRHQHIYAIALSV
jgi:hypothetical protein